jgi:hypothetical protein
MNAMNAPALISPVIPAHPQVPFCNWLRGFPLCSFLELGAYENAPGAARGHARNVLAEWGLATLTDAVCLVISEMVTNSLRATQQAPWKGGLPPVRLWLLGGAGPDAAGQVMIVVWDAVAEPPVQQAAGEQDVSGRGLGIVDWLSGRQWDWYRPAAPYGGKVTQALIDHPWREQPPE